MTLYFVSYALPTGSVGTMRHGWEEVPFEGPVTDGASLRKLECVLDDLIAKRWGGPGLRVTILSWRRFEAPE
jgi:hypothetical protein